MSSLDAAEDHNGNMNVGMVVPLGGMQVFYPVGYLYSVLPAAASIGDDALLQLIAKFPARIG
jgi:hypothetical protein